MLTDTTGSPYAKVHALDGMKVKWTGGLWKERFDTCANSTVPQLKHMFDSKDISHVVENFKICAGDSEGDFDGTVFGDGDFYKWMESAIYTAYMTDIFTVKHVLQLRHGTVCASVKAFFPKAAGPLYFHTIQGMNLRVGGSGCICQHDYSPSVISYSD